MCLQESVAGAVGPTLPGGLVVRIRRSHRRGPGSIPGQGSFSSSSLHLHFPKPRSSPSIAHFCPTPTAHQQHNSHNSNIPARPPAPKHTLPCARAHAHTLPHPIIPHTRLSSSRSPCLHAAHSFPTLPLRPSLSAPTHQLCTSPLQTRCLPWKQDYTPAPITSGPSSHAARITNTRPLVPLMEPQQDSSSSSPALKSGTNPLASPSHLPQMDPLSHTHSMQRTHPIGQAFRIGTKERPVQASVAIFFI